MTLAGICLVLLKQGGDEGVPQNFILGVVLLMIAVFSEVGHASLTKLLADGYKPQVIVMYQFLIGTVYFLPFFLTRGIENFDARLVSWEVLEPILCLAVLCSSLAFSLWAMAIKKLGVGKSSVFLAMMCVATALVAEVIGREHLSLFQWLGVLIAVHELGHFLAAKASASSSPSTAAQRIVRWHSPFRYLLLIGESWQDAIALLPIHCA